MAISAGMLCLACATLAHRQSAVWKDSRSLFEHALSVTEANYVAHTGLGLLELDEGGAGAEAARAHFETAVEHAPRFYEARLNLGWLINLQGDPAAGLEHLREAAEIRPDESDVRIKLGLVLGNLRRWDDAEAALLEARRLDPDAPVDQALATVRERRARGD